MVRILHWGRVQLEDDVPITDVQLRTHWFAERRWRPNDAHPDLSYSLPGSHLRLGYVYVADAKGRTAITPPLRSGPTPRYTWRCSDRQNFFGFALPYTGTRLADVDLAVPTFGTDEGSRLWPNEGGPRRGANMAPLLEFPFAGPAVYITDAFVDQRYWRAQWEDVAYDGKASQGTSRSRVYEARVRFYDFKSEEEGHNSRGHLLMPTEVTVSLRTPVVPDGPVFPRFTRVDAAPKYGWADPASGKEVTGELKEGFVDLPAGGFAGDVVALTDGIRVRADGQVGFVAQDAGGPLPAGTTWTAQFIRVPADKLGAVRPFMGAAGATPYKLELARGKLDRIAYAAWLRAEGGGVAGTVTPAAEAPWPLPLVIDGLSCNWHAALVREGAEPEPIGVFEGKGYARLDVTKGGKFYAGNIIAAQDRRLNLTVLSWDAGSITIEANNPTQEEIKTLLQTPEEVVGKYRLQQEVTVPAGACVRLALPQKQNDNK
jgi:hypothetical protein